MTFCLLGVRGVQEKGLEAVAEFTFKQKSYFFPSKLTGEQHGDGRKVLRGVFRFIARLKWTSPTSPTNRTGLFRSWSVHKLWQLPLFHDFIYNSHSCYESSLHQLQGFWSLWEFFLSPVSGCVCARKSVSQCACLHAYIRALWIQLFHWSLWLMHTRHSDSRKVHWNTAPSFSPVSVCGASPSFWPLASRREDCLCIWSARSSPSSPFTGRFCVNKWTRQSFFPSQWSGG